MNVEATRILNGLGKAKYCNLIFLIKHPSVFWINQEIIHAVDEE